MISGFGEFKIFKKFKTATSILARTCSKFSHYLLGFWREKNIDTERDRILEKERGCRHSKVVDGRRVVMIGRVPTFLLCELQMMFCLPVMVLV